MRILIPEYGRQVLAGIRALARAGHSITLGVPGEKRSRVRSWSRYAYSRYVDCLVPLPPLLDVPRYVQALVQLGTENRHDVILPFGNETTSIVSHHRNTLARCFAMAVPPYDVLVNAHDKARTFKLVEGSSVPIPKTCVVYDHSDLEEVGRTIGYPVVMKARINSGVARGLRYARAFPELEKALDAITGQPSISGIREFNEPIIQEFIPGDLYDVCTLFNHGELRAALVQQRVVMYPVDGGAGIINRTVRNPELIQQAAEVGRLLAWHGPAQIEFKHDPRDDRYKLIEVNPKLWGTLALSIQAGMNFPELAARLAADGDVPKVERYRVGVTYKWLISHALMLLREPTTRKEALKYLHRPWLFNAYYDFSPRDPLPDLVLIWKLLAASVRKIV